MTTWSGFAGFRATLGSVPPVVSVFLKFGVVLLTAGSTTTGVLTPGAAGALGRGRLSAAMAGREGWLKSGGELRPPEPVVGGALVTAGAGARQAVNDIRTIAITTATINPRTRPEAFILRLPVAFPPRGNPLSVCHISGFTVRQGSTIFNAQRRGPVTAFVAYGVELWRSLGQSDRRDETRIPKCREPADQANAQTGALRRQVLPLHRNPPRVPAHNNLKQHVRESNQQNLERGRTHVCREAVSRGSSDRVAVVATRALPPRVQRC